MNAVMVRVINFFFKERLSFVDFMALAILVHWSQNFTWLNFLGLMAFLISAGCFKAGGALLEQSDQWMKIANEIEKHLRPVNVEVKNGVYPIDEWDEKPIE